MTNYIDAAFIQRALNQATMNVPKDADTHLRDLKAALQLAIGIATAPVEPKRAVWDRAQAARAVQAAPRVGDAAAQVGHPARLEPTTAVDPPFRTKCPEHKEPRAPMQGVSEDFGHYTKDVAHVVKVDVYRVLELFEVTSPPLQHAVKKLLVPGGRGAKDVDTDVAEAIKSLQRFQEMRREDAAK